MTRRAALLLLLLAAVMAATAPAAAPAAFAQGDPVTVTLYRDTVSLTVYIPGPEPVDVSGFALEVVNAEGARQRHRLDEYPGFLGLDYSALLTPVCFRLIENGQASPPPSACVNDAGPMRTFTQTLAPADVFWYSDFAGAGLPVFVLNGETGVGQCPGANSECPVIFSSGGQDAPPTETIPPADTPTDTPAPPPPGTPDAPTPAPSPAPTGGGSGQILISAVTADNLSGSLVIRTVGSSEQLDLTPGGYIEFLPRWSPDGERIAFLSIGNGVTDLHVMDADGNNRQNLTNNPDEETFFSWSPDGEEIVFSANAIEINIAEPFELDAANVANILSALTDAQEPFLLDIASGTETQLLENQGWELQAEWSPDGQQLLIVTLAEGRSEIFVFETGGGEPYSLLAPEGTGYFFATWRPEPAANE